MASLGNLLRSNITYSITGNHRILFSKSFLFVQSLVKKSQPSTRLAFPTESFHGFKMANSNSNQSYPEGGPLLEVFGFLINRIHGDDQHGKLYGTITFGEVDTHLHNRERLDAENIYPGSSPLLTGPSDSAISAGDPFTIDLDLMHRNEDGQGQNDEEISKGFIDWNVYNLGAGKDYNKFLKEKVRGRDGSATLFYAVFSRAVSVYIEVSLANSIGELCSAAKVYGEVVAINNMISEGESVLFRKERSEINCDDVTMTRPDDQLIPLSRRIVAVPVSSDLHVRVKLWDSAGAGAGGVEIADGVASFQPQMAGLAAAVGKICGRYGEVAVKVTWEVY